MDWGGLKVFNRYRLFDRRENGNLFIFIPKRPVLYHNSVKQKKGKVPLEAIRTTLRIIKTKTYRLN